MKLITKSLQVFLLVVFIHQFGFSQTCPTSSINAQAGTGASTTICVGQCATLTASVVANKTTASYSVAATPYAPFSFFGGAAAIGNIDDVWGATLNIGFNFCYFGNTFNQLVIGSNGEITFDLTAAGGAEFFSVNNVLPNLIEHRPNTICGAYRDIDPSSGIGSTVTSYTAGVAPCRRFVANWTNVPLYNCLTPTSTFQIVLYEKSNIIDVYIQNSTACMTWQAGAGLIGIQNAAGTTVVAPPGRNVLTPWTALNEAWRFTPTGAPTFTVSWAGPAGFTAAGLTAIPCPTATSNYTATMVEANCGIGTTSYTSAVQVSVTPTPTITIVASPTAICVGSSSTLSAIGATSYTWNPGGLVGASITVSPASSTIYTVTGTVGSCTATKTINLVVNPLPTITASSNPTVVCSGNSATLTATGGLTYTWSPGALTGSSVVVTPAATTIYTVVGTNSLSCTNTSTVLLTVSNLTLTSSASPTVICNIGSSTLTAAGATTYTWNPGGLLGASVVVSPTITTTYTVTGVTGSCSTTNTITLLVSASPTITATSSPVLVCSGTNATLTAIGGSTYLWSPGALTGASIVITPTATTIYTVTGTNAAGCSSTNTLAINVKANPVITSSASPTIICIGSSSTLTALGGISYTWSPGGLTTSTISVSPLVTTVYTVTGSNASGCIGTSTLSLNVSIPAVTAVSSPTAICAGSSATLTGSGASTYTWNPGAITGTSVVVTPTATTIYTVAGTTTVGCTASTTLNLIVNPNPTVTAASSPTAICAGSSATLTGGGATSYTWNPGALTGSTVSVSPAATTIYTVTGLTGSCPNSTTVSLTVNSNPTITTTASPTIICLGGSSTLTALGGLSYTWSPGGLTTSTISVSPVATTVYTVTGSNASGCIGTSTLSVNVSTPTVTALSSPTAICAGSSATLTGSGASTYTWNPGAITGTSVVVTPTATTIYTVAGTTTVGCTASTTLNLIVNPNPTVTAVSSPTAICAGSSATLTGGGATSYTWNPGALTGSTVSVSPAATTIYTVTGLTGSCSKTSTVSLLVNTNPTITTTASPTIICLGGSSTLTALGGLSYTWSPGGLTTSTISVSPIATAVYTVTGSNASGCIGTSTLSVNVSTPTVTAVSSPTAICAGLSATLTGSGASTYTWNPGAITGTSVVVTPTATTVYTVVGTTTVGCTASTTLNLIVNPNPTVTAVSSPTAICAGSSATITGGGATSYTWNPGALTGSTVSVSPAATTVYTVTGLTGSCSKTSTVSLLVNTNPTITTTASPTIICLGGSSTLTALGGLSYTWSPGGLTTSTISVSPIATTVYTVTGSNASGCIGTSTLSVNVSTPIVTAVSSPTAICAGSSATLTGSGASTYTWNPGAITGTSVVVTPTATTVYTVVGTTIVGCTSSKTLNLIVNPNPTVTAVSSPTAICAGSSATLTGGGATTYTWNPGALTGSTVSVSPAATTIYTVTGLTGSCSKTSTVSLLVNTNPTITTTASPTIICLGSSSTLTALGALNYTWSPGGLTTSTISVSPIATTVYTVTGSNALGCTSTKTVNLVVSPTPTITAVSSPTAICAGSSATLTGSGASTYTWNPGAITGTSVVVTPTATTIYTVVGTTIVGCTSSKTLNLIVNPNPTVTAVSSPTAICAGSSATLTGGGATSYTWNPGALTGSTVSVSPAATTVYTVTGLTGSCSKTSTVSLLVNTNPTITTTASPTIICLGSSSTLTGLGALNYTWSPGGLTTSTISVSPIATTVYSVTGSNALGCTSTKTVNLIVSPTPTITTVSSSTAICAGTSATLTGSGASTYTWNPGAITGTSVVVTPTATTVYTVVGTTTVGCTASTTVNLIVNPSPTVTAVSSPTAICAGSSATLTGGGATSYTWNPGALTGSTVSVSPAATTVYTVTGFAGGCSNSTTVSITVSSNPTITASASSNTICAGSAATLTALGGSTYTWSPGGLTSNSIVVTPSVTTTYTVDGDNGLGCLGSQTIIINVNAAPSVSIVASPTVLCAAGSVTLTASGANTYSWNPTAALTASVVDNPTVTTTYTVTGTDLIGCSSNQTITIGVGNPTITIVSTPTLLCLGTTATLTASGASSYTWSPLAAVGSTITDAPIITTTYTVTGDNGFGCISTNTFVLTVVTCTVPSNVLGMTKAVGTPTFVNNNAYNVTYTIVATNASTVDLTNFSIIDNLNSTFPLPSTFSVISAPLVTSINSSLTINPIFNGTTQNDLLIPLTSTLVASKKDTIVFTVQINPNGVFGPYYNSAIGFGNDNLGTLVSDSSNTGFAWDPDLDGDPTNNDTLTVVSLIPHTSIGVAKSGSVSALLDDKTYDVTYIISVTNLGNDTLKLVTVLDTLTIPAPAVFTIKSGPIASGSLTANSLYNGVSDINLLNPLLSNLAPGAVETITLVLNITPNDITSITNSAIGIGVGVYGGIVRDTSNMGSNADPNGNGNATESGENIPTVLELPDINLFIPEVFTPDGDGKNDFFVIKGINGRTVKITVFNRWGNKVYEVAAYDNTWNGTQNVGGLIIGTNKLPQGTYYYIVEFDDGITKPINGYVVLQY